MELVFTWHIDADADIDRALMYDKAEEAARISQGVEAGNRILESWVLRSHGRMLDEQGVSGSAQLSAEYLEELPDIVRQVEEATQARMHVGVGAESSEAVIARRIAEERGGDPAIILYTPDLSEEARKLDEMSESEASALDGEAPDDGVVGGGEAGVPGASVGGLGKAEQGQKQPGEATQVAQGQLSPTAAMPSPPPSASISASAPSPGQPPAQQGQPGGEPSEDEVLQAVGQTLEQFKAQLPAFEQMKQSNPQAYQAVMAMVEGMVAMAQRLAGGSEEATPPSGAKGESMQKAEDEPDPAPQQPSRHHVGRDLGYGEWDDKDDDEDDLEKADPIPREKLDPKSWHIQHAHDSGAQSYVTHRGSYSATPSQYTQFPTEDVATQHLRQVAARHARPVEAYRAVQGVGDVFKGEVDPRTGESSKVEQEPHEAMPSVEELRKIYDTLSGAPTMAFAEDDYFSLPPHDPFLQFLAGFQHETKTQPHLDTNNAAQVAWQHLQEDPQYYAKLAPPSIAKAAPSATGRHLVVLPPGSRGVGAKARSVKVVEPVTGKATWHQVSVGQKLSGDGHPLSPRVAECPSADTPEKRAQDAGLVGVPSASKPGQTAQE